MNNANQPGQRDAFAAVLLLLMLLLACAYGTGLPVPQWLAGVAAWCAGILLWPRLDMRQRKQTVLLFVVGVAALCYAALHGVTSAWKNALTQNNALLAMLVAVSFLQLLDTAPAQQSLPRGRRALWQTLFGVHILGAAINLSAVFIMLERISRTTRPDSWLSAALVRAFLGAALWSPFFAAVAVTITYAPGATMLSVSITGLPFALLLLLLAGLMLMREMPAGGRDFVGYPMQASTLHMPALLALVVMLAHFLLPWGSLTIISLSALSMAVLTTWWRAGLRDGTQRIARQMHQRLPAMAGELLLFLAAAVFAAGLQGMIQGENVWQPFQSIGVLQAILLLGVMIVLAMLGIHAVISIAMVSAWIAPLTPDPILMAAAFTQSWAIGLAVSPLSGIHLALQGRYHFSATTLAGHNIRYGILAYLLAALWLLAIGLWRDLPLF